MARVSPGEFIRQVRQEANKVTWPSRKETVASTGMVLLMVFFAAAFFFLIDLVLSEVVQRALTLGS